jgi:hypothetical protein
MKSLFSATREGGTASTLQAFILSAAVLWIDYVTGEGIDFPIFYIVPVGLAAWRNQQFLACLLSFVLSLVRFAFQSVWSDQRSLLTEGINTLVIIAALLLYAYLIDRTSTQTRKLQKRVKTLEGILPICASCKRIRNENNEYEPIENYISERSEASFSHGLCSACAHKLYPDLFPGDELIGG